MQIEKKHQFNLSQPEYRSFIVTRGKLALIDIERNADAITKRIGEEPVGDGSLSVVQNYLGVSEFVIRELGLSIPLTDRSFLSNKERIEYSRSFGLREHNIPQHEFNLWYFSGFNKRPPMILTEERITQLRKVNDRAVISLDTQTAYEIAERFKREIDRKIKTL